MPSLSSLRSTLLSCLPHREASPSLPPVPEIDERPRQLSIKVHADLDQVMRCEWWPRGLGLLVDWGGIRHQVEPAEGASAWLQIVRKPEGWGSSTKDCTFVGDERSALFQAVVTELRLHVGSLNPGLLDRLPASAVDMGKNFMRAKRRLGDLSHDAVKRPAAGRFSVGEALSPEIPLEAGSAQAAVSRRLGAVLLERFDWSRPVVLERRPFKALDDERKRGGAQAGHWSLRVANDRGDIDLVLHNAAGERSLGTVLKAGPHVRGATIFRPAPRDDLGSDAAGLAAFHHAAPHTDKRFFVPEAAHAVQNKLPLSALDRHGRVVVVAHSRSMRKPSYLHRVRDVGGRTPDALARDLIASGLPDQFAGTVFLETCGSMTDALHPRAYAERLRATLASRGFDRVSVAMRPGTSSNIAGRARTVPEKQVQRPPLTTDGRLRLPTAKDPKRAWYLRPWDSLRRLFGQPRVSRRVRTDKVSTQVISGSKTVSLLDPNGAQGMWGFFGAVKQRR